MNKPQIFLKKIHLTALCFTAFLLVFSSSCKKSTELKTEAVSANTKSGQISVSAVSAPNYEMTRDLSAPYTYRTELASVKSGAPIRDAFGNSLGTVNATNPKEFHIFERIPVTLNGSNTYLYWMRGAYSRESVSGYISQGYIENPSALAGAIDIRAANGNGAARTTTTIGYANLQPISEAMGYNGPSDGVCRQYHWYGIKGTYPSGTPYAYVIWSLPNVRGGGLNRTFIKQGEAFRYTDTYPVTVKAYRYQSPGSCITEEVGWVEFKYIRIYQNGHFFYGWAVSRSYFKDEGVVKAHMTDTPPA